MAAKSCRDDKTKWLPFPVHSEDTAGIAVLLFQKWLPEAARNYISRLLSICSDPEQNEIAACNFCKFISLVHDIGKLTPAFQSKISQNIENHTDLLSNEGFNLSMLTHIAQSPHNIAGQYILENEFNIPEEISVIVGAHHGSCSYDISEQEGFPSNYYGYKSADKEKWTELRSQWFKYALNKSGFSDAKSLPIPDVKVQMILTGLLIMSDWIASKVKSTIPLFHEKALSILQAVSATAKLRKSLRKGCDCRYISANTATRKHWKHFRQYPSGGEIQNGSEASCCFCSTVIIKLNYQKKFFVTAVNDAKAQFYSMIDLPFRIWLEELDTESDIDEYSQKIETEIKQIALSYGQELVSQLNASAIFGRRCFASAQRACSAA